MNVFRGNKAWCELRKAGELGRVGSKVVVKLGKSRPPRLHWRLPAEGAVRPGDCSPLGWKALPRARAGLPAAREVTRCLGPVVLPSARVRPAMLPLLRCVPRALGAAASGLRTAIPAPPLRHLLQPAPRPCLRPFGLLSVRAGSARRSGLLQPPVPCACGCGALHTEGKVHAP